MSMTNLKKEKQVDFAIATIKSCAYNNNNYCDFQMQTHL